LASLSASLTRFLSVKLLVLGERWMPLEAWNDLEYQQEAIRSVVLDALAVALDL